MSKQPHPISSELLVELYTAATPPGSLRRTPWTWGVLTDDQTHALAAAVATWVDHYNQVHAVAAKDIIPNCWPQHPALAHELAVLLWAYYHAHHDPKATPFTAAEYHARYLSSFRTRLDHMLGRDPIACKEGLHPATWLGTRPPDPAQRTEVGLHDSIRNGFGFA